MAMSLEEEDEPFTMPNLPQFRSNDKNVFSLIGRLLNQDCQSMTRLILHMPRKWQKYDRIRGVALSKERFQFFFKHEHDLVEILEKGVHTFDEWALATERWVENPPVDFLQFIPLWVRIRNIPVNYFTTPAITALGELVGQVTEVAFDPDKPLSRDFVRVKVRFDVSKPLRRSKVINLDNGATANIIFDYERIQKRCYSCQRLTHEQNVCPLLIKKYQDLADTRKATGFIPLPKKANIISESDPLFGVLREDQVGINPANGRLRIAKDVLEGMRQYLLIANGEERKLREFKVRNSVAEVEKDPIAQKTILRLESLPLISRDVNKGKGIVFDYDSAASSTISAPVLDSGKKLLASAIRAEETRSWSPAYTLSPPVIDDEFAISLVSPFKFGSTAYRGGFSEATPSGTKPIKKRQRKRPYISRRTPKSLSDSLFVVETTKSVGLSEGQVKKRKVGKEIVYTSKAAKKKKKLVVPIEGPSNI